LFLPFLIIDSGSGFRHALHRNGAVASVMISAPFKILLFVLWDAGIWVIGSLLKSFY